MARKKPESCKGCKALIEVSGGMGCSLGFSMSSRATGTAHYNQYPYVPNEPCDKPRTKAKLEELLSNF